MLTVLLATRNRAAVLAKVLSAYEHVVSPETGWKIVIVDNGSGDHTQEVLRSFRDRLPLTIVHEPKPGKNVSLNVGLLQVDGDLVVLTDDDAFPDPFLLVEMKRCADAHQDYSIFGGRILPRWEQSPTEWIQRYVPKDIVFALTGEWKEGPTPPEMLFGPNMAVRAAIFAAGYRFDEKMGPRLKAYPMGGETEFTRRLARDGYRAWHCERAVVHHFISAKHIERKWIFGRAVRFGRGQYRMDCRESFGAVTTWSRELRHLLRGARNVCAEVHSKRRGEIGAYLFQAEWGLHFVLGRVQEARNMRREYRSSQSVLKPQLE
jgi:glycosyltransferase involved in cell wall biosynthesis